MGRWDRFSGSPSVGRSVGAWGSVGGSPWLCFCGVLCALGGRLCRGSAWGVKSGLGWFGASAVADTVGAFLVGSASASVGLPPTAEADRKQDIIKSD